MAAGLHIAGGGDEYHRALKLFEQRAINKLNALTVRQIVVQQQQTWLMQEEQFAGLWATCVQHEIDHLNGKLFIDFLGPLKRQMITRKMEKLKRERARQA